MGYLSQFSQQDLLKYLPTCDFSRARNLGNGDLFPFFNRKHREHCQTWKSRVQEVSRDRVTDHHPLSDCIGTLRLSHTECTKIAQVFAVAAAVFLSQCTSHFYRNTFAKVCPPLGRKWLTHHQFVSQYASHLYRDRSQLL